MRSRPASLVAERAVRYLLESGKPVPSIELARELLSLKVGDEAQATRVLGTAFGGDPRLSYEEGAWRPRTAAPEPEPAPGEPQEVEPDLAFVLVEGERPAAGARFALRIVSAVRRRGAEVVAACGGELAGWTHDHELKQQLRALLEGARVALHAPPGGLGALEAWLEEPLTDPLPIALLARRRAGIAARHDVEALAAALGLAVRIDDDAARRIEVLPACFDALREPGEPWGALVDSCRPRGDVIPWPRYAFTREDLQALPSAPGTYRFFDHDGKLLYVGKSRSLRRRLASWFREDARRSPRARAIVEAVHRFEADPSGSDLEALLREAGSIRRDAPEHNVQREIHAHPSRAQRLASILILEPAEAPFVLRAWLIREGRLLDAVPLGRRGGGLARVARILESEFFDPRVGPRSARARPVDVEIVARWLAEHRDRAVAFDPTHLKSTEDVVSRLRWFLERGTLGDPEGSPILPR